MLAPLGIEGAVDLFPLLLLASTAAALVVLGGWLHGRTFAEGLSRSQEGSERRDPGRSPRRAFSVPLVTSVPLSARSLVAKDVRTFFRDTTQWSQLILLGVLVVVYIYNISVLPLFSGEDVGFFLKNVIAFLNLGLAGFVLAAIAARFLFPAISLEGRSLWLLRSSPLRLSSLVWSKFWVGSLPLLVLALALTAGTNVILRVEGFIMVLSLVTITVMTFALAALALGFGAMFPKFDTENAAEIPTGFGGLLFMMTAIGYLAAVVVLEARPVYVILEAQARGHSIDASHWSGLAVGLGLATLISLAAIALPLRTAVRRIEALEP
jgi:ABC-2 type transport system permease protein